MSLPSEPSARQLAELADVILDLAHKLDIRNPELRDVVPLTGTEIAVIREVHRNPHSTPTQIAEATGLQRSNVSTAVRTLEAGGLVTRAQMPDNARSITLAPTALAAESVERINAYWVELLSRAPAAALTNAADTISSLAEIASSMRAH